MSNMPDLEKLVIAALEDLKGLEIKTLDVRAQTTVTDTMVICSGTSNRHVQSLADNVAFKAKQQGYTPLGVEGQSAGEWVLVDLNQVVVHIMLPRIRDFYNLEKLWGDITLSRKQHGKG